MTATPTTRAESRSLKLTVQAVLDRFGIGLALVILMALLAYLRPGVFLSNENLTNVARQTSLNALLALGEFLVILTAGIDLSVGAVMALSMILMALFSHTFYDWYAAYYAQLGATSLPDPQSAATMLVISALAILLGLVVGLFAGLLNGWGTTKLRLPHPFIATLGMLNIARGATDLISGGAPITGMPQPMRAFGAGTLQVVQTPSGDWLGIPLALLVVLGFIY